MSDIAHEENLSLGDPDAWLIGQRSDLFVDPVHFSVESTRLIAEGLRKMIKTILMNGEKRF